MGHCSHISVVPLTPTILRLHVKIHLAYHTLFDMSSEAIRAYATAALEKLPVEKLREIVKDAPVWKLGLGAGLSYLALVRLLRYRRQHAVARKYPYKTREDFAKMTANDAQAIMRSIFECEFPFIGEKALQFALFR